MANNNEVTSWVGWVFFAGFVMILQGFFQAIIGLTALFNSSWLAVGNSDLLFLNLDAWGWVHLILGAIMLVAGFSVIKGMTWALALGVIMAMLSAIANLLAINLHPLWSVIIILVDVLVIYALTVHGGEMKNLS